MRIDRMWLHFKNDCIIVDKEKDLVKFNLAVSTGIDVKVNLSMSEWEAFKEWKAAREPLNVEKVEPQKPKEEAPWFPDAF